MNGKKVNEKKSIQCKFTLKQADYPRIFLNNVTLATAQNVRYLGLQLDCRLTWKTQSNLTAPVNYATFSYQSILISKLNSLYTKCSLNLSGPIVYNLEVCQAL